MRIGFDAKRAFRNFTGLGNYSRSTISILADYYPNNEYFLYTTFYKNNPLQYLTSQPNVHIHQPEGLLKRLPSVWRYYGLGTDLLFDGIDIFHGLTAELPVRLPAKTRSIVTIHDLIFLRYPQYYNSIDRWIYTHKYRSACERADLIIAISEQTKQEIIDFFGVDEKKIRLVYQGCDPQFYRESPPREKANVKSLYKLPDNYILCVGTIEDRKNLLTLVKALNLLPAHQKLVVVGKPTAYLEGVMEYITANNLENRIVFLPRTAFNHLPAIYQQAGVVCFPSLFEGFGIPALEALNSKVPLVSSNASSLPEAGGPGSLYVDPLDHVAMADALNKALTDEVLRQKMIAMGLEHAQNFREEHIAKNLWSVYQELM